MICLDGIDAIPVKGYEVIHHSNSVTVPYPLDANDECTRAEGRWFHHGRFVQSLRQVAFNTPNITVLEVEVTDAVRIEPTGQVIGVDGKTSGRKVRYLAPLTVVADGYNSRFRKKYLSREPISKSRF